ncbi:MAG: glutamate-1-semialdehyde 2,1-aminomutase [Candidatus Omnitrophica bacterium]|nr:glutamate-1-semialdehyde 2,1-aminomutase [Candidatus Omnitrophota bacterium]MDE2213904.1 glutamate-1-semialdehyde 2,1-aminomutase [Candidatus Omnitrophota bacterium]MDE2231837.1 glutamate-1-semialdehyde 2,1-aminomutase [Candidatus Omnitrophota bacterium]
MASMNTAQKVMVGGVNSPVRAFKAVGGNPLVMAQGRGSKLFDINGRSYTDYCLSWGALILGHAHPDVTAAVCKAARKGTSFGTTTSPEIEIARFIVKHVPSVDMVRFVNSGTEATMSAVRLSRGFTKRRKIIKFDGCYHGHSDDLLAVAGSGVAFLPASSSQGIPKAHMQDTLSLPFNDTQTLQHTIERHHADLACVIVEPVAGNMGVINPHLDFLKTLRALTKKYGIVLIFDEVMSGLRSGLGCVQADLGIIPDLTCLGKIIGGGFPVGAYGGRRDIMKCLSPLGGVYQAGTFSGTPVVMQAGLAVLKNLTPKMYKDLNTICDDFVGRTNLVLRRAKVKAHLVNYKSMISIRFSDNPVDNYAQARQASSDKLYAKLFHHLLRRGIYLPPADLESFFVSSRHSLKDINALGRALQDFFTGRR